MLAAPPSASITAPSLLQIGQVGTFTATTSDPDGGSITLIEWDFEDDGTVDKTGASVSHSYGTAGQKTVRLRVTDSAAEVTEATATVTVNAPPVARITAEPTRAQIGQSVAFSGSDSSDPDPGDSIQTYEWDLGTGSFGSPSASPDAPPISFATGGDKNIRLRVTDKFGGAHVATLVFHVNLKPLAKFIFAAVNPPSGQTGVALDPGQNLQVPIIGQWVAFSSQSTDSDGTIKAHAWFDANIPGEGPTGLFTGPFAGNRASPIHVPYTIAGNMRVLLQVTDNEDAVSETNPPTPEALATVRVNTRPESDFVFSPQTPVVGETITFAQAADDPDPDSLANPPNGLVTKFEWDLDNDGTFGETGETGGRVQRKFDSAGAMPVKLRVTDGAGARHEATKTVDVATTRPDARFTSSPQDPLPGQAITFTSGSIPTSGKAITKVEWDFDYDQRTFTADTGGPPATHNSVSHAFPSHGVKTVAVRVTETGDGIDIASGDVRVNGPPQASFQAAPETPLTDDTVTLSSTSADPDGPISQAWDTDNDGQFDDASGAVASRKFTAPGDYTVRLRVTDDRGASAVATGLVKVAQRPAQGALSGRLTVIDVTVQIAGRPTKRGAKLSLLRVRAPSGTLIKLKCKGDDCPLRSKRTQVKKGKVRFKKLEQSLDAGTKIIIEATLDGFIGKRVTYKIRKGTSPKRKDLCIQPGAKKATACPG